MVIPPRRLSENSRLQENRPSRIEPVRRAGSFFGKIEGEPSVKHNLLSEM